MFSSYNYWSAVITTIAVTKDMKARCSLKPPFCMTVSVIFSSRMLVPEIADETRIRTTSGALRYFLRVAERSEI